MVQNGAMHPSDIDAVLEFDNQILILIEVKKQGIKIPLGQRLLLERICDSWRTHMSVVLKVEYFDVYDIVEDIPLEQCFVTRFYYNKKWHNFEKKASLVWFVNHLGKKWGNEKCRF
tara:strand:- start:275 stop:622 length:348 start_codon:yes stop_codon:yes gene_type:complete